MVVSYPCGRSWMKWWAWASLAASMIRGRVFIESPRPILTRTESVKTRSACKTVATWARTDSKVTSRRSWPSIKTRPDRGSSSRGIKQTRASLASSSCPMMAVREPAGISSEIDSSSRRPERLSSSTLSKAICSFEGVEEMSSDVLVKLGPPFQELEDPARRPVGLTNRSSQPEPFRDRIGQSRQRDHQDQHRRNRDLIVDDDVLAQKPQRDRQGGAIEQARAGVDRSAGDDPPRVGPKIPIQVFVEPLAVVVAHAIGPDRPEQAQIFVQQAKLNRSVAKAPIRICLSSVAVQGPRDQPDEQTQRRQESRQERRDQERDHQQAGRQDLDSRASGRGRRSDRREYR